MKLVRRMRKNVSVTTTTTQRHKIIMAMTLAIAVASTLTFAFGTAKIMGRVRWKRQADAAASQTTVPDGWWYVDVTTKDGVSTVLDASTAVQWKKGQALMGDDVKELIRRAAIGNCGFKRITIPVTTKPPASTAVPGSSSSNNLPSHTVSTRYSYAVLRNKNTTRIVGTL